ncbi:hypothetical protein GQR58_009977 [Nymphon striatum]|nr:hypothetical protein GQR58_009977 [Nymphon striatum]
MKIGFVKMPQPFQKKVSNWLQQKKELIEEVKRQEILHVKNKYTNEFTAYNALRGKRPFVKPKADPLEYFTSEDDLGRVESELSATSSNTFKYDSYHQLVFPKHCHNPLELTKELVVDMFMTAYAWFKKVHSSDRSYRYPMVMWDTFPHGGASQVHPHVQASIDKSGYYGLFETIRNSADAYSQDYEGMNNYFTDLKDLHSALGLACQHGSATAFAHLRQDDKSAKMPVFMRILSRGTVSSMNADISSLELFAIYSVLFQFLSIDHENIFCVHMRTVVVFGKKNYQAA